MGYAIIVEKKKKSEKVTGNNKKQIAMGQLLDNQIQAQKIYRDKSMWLVAFLGGTLAAGYIIAENFKTFNEPQKAKRTQIVTVLATISVFACVFSIPEDAAQFIPVIYTAIASALMQHLQGERILNHINSGGQVFGKKRTFCVGLIGLVITVAAIAIIAFMAGDFSNSVTTKTYGTMQHEIFFEKDNITEYEIEKMADGFTEIGFFGQAVTKHVYAKKNGRDYEISIFVVEGAEKDSEALEAFMGLRNDLQLFFADNKIILNLVVDDLDNVVKQLN
jgi:hypothetical protein